MPLFARTRLPLQLLLSLWLIGFAMTSFCAAADRVRAYVGTYSQRGSKGIYVLDLDLKTGALSQPKVAAESQDPSFLAIHPNRKFLYSVNEVGEFKGQKAGAVTSFSINTDGSLTKLNQQTSGGPGPCHLIVDKAGKNVLVANYGGGSAEVIPINPDGSLKPPSDFKQHQGSSVNKDRQEAPHAHSINLDADNRFAVVADLGLDQVLVYRFDSSRGTLTPNSPPAASVAPGAGPRHFAFHPSGKFAFVINELLSTVTAFRYDSQTGTLKEIQTTSTLPSGFPGENNSTAEVVVHPSGKFLYGSNRGHNTIAGFRIDSDSGQLRSIGHRPTEGKIPRNFAIDPTGTFLLAENQDSDTIVVFRINQDSGELSPTGHQVSIPMPVCVRFMDPQP